MDSMGLPEKFQKSSLNAQSLFFFWSAPGKLKTFHGEPKKKGTERTACSSVCGKFQTMCCCQDLDISVHTNEIMNCFENMCPTFKGLYVNNIIFTP